MLTAPTHKGHMRKWQEHMALTDSVASRTAEGAFQNFEAPFMHILLPIGGRMEDRN
jgi:hypothetical protein